MCFVKNDERGFTNGIKGYKAHNTVRGYKRNIGKHAGTKRALQYKKLTCF